VALLRTKQLAIHTQAVAGAAEGILTVPASYRAVVRDVRIANFSGANATGVQAFVLDSGGTVVQLVYLPTLANLGTFGLLCDVVLEQNQAVIVQASVAGVAYLLSGALLTVSP
jgi:hypothetical protein